jgi:hypothetical protein
LRQIPEHTAHDRLESQLTILPTCSGHAHFCTGICKYKNKKTHRSGQRLSAENNKQGQRAKEQSERGRSGERRANDSAQDGD